MSTDIPFSDYLAITNLTFDWAQSYDLKDWDLLRTVLATPTLHIDFRSAHGPLIEAMPTEQFISFLASDAILGDPRMKTQHFLGTARWEKLSEDSIHVAHQSRVKHQRYKDLELTEVANKGHGHGVTQLWYRRVEGGGWKVSGCTVDLEWTEYDFWGTVDPSKAVIGDGKGGESKM